MAHPFHLCVGHMRWNADNNVWEVALRIDPGDLETAIASELSTPENVQYVDRSDSKFSEQLTEYLGRYFVLWRTDKEVSPKEFAELLDASAKPSPQGKEESESTKPASDRSTLKWVGMEQEKGWLWVYVELTPPPFEPEKHRLWMVHQLLLVTVDDQTNSVLVEKGPADKFNLQFKLGASFRPFEK